MKSIFKILPILCAFAAPTFAADEIKKDEEQPHR